MCDVLVIESICRVTAYICATVGAAFSGSDCAIVPVNRASYVDLLREGCSDACGQALRGSRSVFDSTTTESEVR